MSTISTSGRQASVIANPDRVRALGVAGAVLAVAAVWVLAVPVSGARLVVRFGSGAPQTVGIAKILGVAVIASLLGWALLAALERRTTRARARAVWTIAACVVLLASLALPVVAARTTGSAVSLAAMHVALAAVLIAALRHDSTAERRPR